MSDLIAAHHGAEAELHRLRLLRDLGLPEYRKEDEDAIADEMEALWYRMTPDEQRILDAERAARIDGLPGPKPPGLPAIDVDEDQHARRGLPVRQAAA